MKRYPRTFSGRIASQSEYELTNLITLLKENGVKRYLEIGARDGDTFHEIVTALGPDSFSVAVDLPGGLWGKEKTAKNFKRVLNNLLSQGYYTYGLLGDSTDPHLISQIKGAAPFDAIFIDGDHTLDGVTRDWENYKDLGKIIIFHDIVGHGQFEKVHNKEVEVPILWERLKKYHRYVEFIDEGSSMGIGVIFNDNHSL